MRRYGLLTALLYDVFSGERPFYRPARLAAVEALRLTPGDRVLVLGCGTGLDLPLVASGVGATGTIVAVDESPVMLRAAAGRARQGLRGRRRPGWPAMVLVQADATRAASLLPPGAPPVDAVLAVNTLSLIPAWRTTWETALRTARPGARVAIADIGRPDPGTAMRLWARTISLVGGGRLDAHPWSVVEEDADLAVARSWWRGHVQLRAGTLR